MAHPEQMAFVKSIRDRYPDRFTGKRALEIGSRNVNGTVLDFFTDCDYVGIDCTEGPGVDVVTLAHEFDAEPFDVVISCEAFEHDPYVVKTFENAVRLLKEGGLFVATFASPNRQEHGTRRRGGEIYGPKPDHYRGIGVFEFYAMIRGRFDPGEVETGRGGEDVYCWGVKA